jgi:hypothetical protein
MCECLIIGDRNREWNSQSKIDWFYFWTKTSIKQRLNNFHLYRTLLYNSLLTLSIQYENKDILSAILKMNERNFSSKRRSLNPTMIITGESFIKNEQLTDLVRQIFTLIDGDRAGCREFFISNITMIT